MVCQLGEIDYCANNDLVLHWDMFVFNLGVVVHEQWHIQILIKYLASSLMHGSSWWLVSNKHFTSCCLYTQNIHQNKVLLLIVFVLTGSTLFWNYSSMHVYHNICNTFPRQCQHCYTRTNVEHRREWINVATQEPTLN